MTSSSEKHDSCHLLVQFEAGDIVLLSRDLSVLIEGILKGRKTFSNPMKYIFMATSANFGNMFSMTGSACSLYARMLLILACYIAAAELAMHLFYRGMMVKPEEVASTG
jgi:magnesium-transporting ATPase (P-type)